MGTGKDLMEDVAAHILLEGTDTYPKQTNFPILLEQAFIYLGLASSEDVQEPGEPIQKKFDRSLFQLACYVNKMRYKERTGHWQPFISSLTQVESIVAIESIGVVSE